MLALIGMPNDGELMQSSLTLERVKALKKCGPLSDPVKALSVWMLLSTLAVVAVFVVPDLLSDKNIPFIIVCILSISVLPMPLAMWLLLKEAWKQPVFYLRAFRSDIDSAYLRGLLKASLGPQYRLCGIRPPRAKVSWWMRLMFSAWATGFKYLGSPRLELEAGNHNWMARLLASYASARFVFIDMRDITVHVEDEIRLSYLAMGAERCIFIFDNASTETERRALVAGALGQMASQLPELNILVYCGDSEDDLRAFVKEASLLASRIPEEAGNLDMAIVFAQQRIAPERWSTRFLETDLGQAIASIIVSWAVVYIMAKLFAAWSWLPQASNYLFTAAVVVLFFSASNRAMYQVQINSEFSRVTGFPTGRMRIICARFLVVIPVVLLFVQLAMPNYGPAIKQMQISEEGSHLKYFSLYLHMYKEETNSFPEASEWDSFLKFLSKLGLTSSRPYTIRDASGKEQHVSELEYLWVDRWGPRIQYEKTQTGFRLRSYGPDRIPKTDDDLIFDETGQVSKGGNK